MAETNYSVEQDLKEAAAMAKALVPYVHQDALYGSSGGGFFSKAPSLTVGALLMRLRRLKALSHRMTDKQLSQLQEIEARNADVIKEWRVHYEGKLQREANSRLDAMKAFFDECSSDPRLCANVYLPEVLRRTIVQEIVIAMSDLGVDNAELRPKIAMTDGQLRRYVQPSDFLWDAELKEVYPQQTFWWMYSRPPEGK